MKNFHLTIRCRLMTTRNEKFSNPFIVFEVDIKADDYEHAEYLKNIYWDSCTNGESLEIITVILQECLKP